MAIFFYMKKLYILFFVLSLISINSAKAELFTLHVEQGSINETASFSSILDLFDKYSDGQLDSVIKNYDKTQAASGTLNFRGIVFNLDFDNSGNLTFKVPSINVNMVFNSNNGTQENSFDQLKDYLKSNQDNLLKDILKAGVSETPYDSVAGNPSSLMSTMVNSSFDISQNNLYGAMVSYLSPSASKHTISFQNKDIEAKVLSLPLGYSFNFGDSGWALLFDMPLTYMDIDGSVSYSAQLGLSLKIPVFKEYWNFVIGSRVGATGSADMLSGGILYSFSGASDFKIPVGKWEFGMTNMIAGIRDYSLKVADYEIEYDLQNYAYKNGVNATYNFTDKYSISTQYNYTFFTGSKLFVEKYHEALLSLNRKFAKGKFIEGLSIVASYAFSGDIYKAYNLGLSIKF